MADPKKSKPVEKLPIVFIVGFFICFLLAIPEVRQLVGSIFKGGNISIFQSPVFGTQAVEIVKVDETGQPAVGTVIYPQSAAPSSVGIQIMPGANQSQYVPETLNANLQRVTINGIEYLEAFLGPGEFLDTNNPDKENQEWGLGILCYREPGLDIFMINGFYNKGLMPLNDTNLDLGNGNRMCNYFRIAAYKYGLYGVRRVTPLMHMGNNP